MYAKVSKKGQVTIPKTIREKLNIENEGAVLFLVENDEVKIKGVPIKSVAELAGSLNKYVKEYKPLKDMRKQTKRKIAEAAIVEGVGE
jgi:AbrB family looped-hinge helix DNA binding protein